MYYTGKLQTWWMWLLYCSVELIHRLQLDLCAFVRYWNLIAAEAKLLILFVSCFAVTFKTYCTFGKYGQWDCCHALYATGAFSGGFCGQTARYQKVWNDNWKVDSNLINGQTILGFIHYVHSCSFTSKGIKGKNHWHRMMRKFKFNKCVTTYKLTNQITLKVLLSYHIWHRGFGSSEIHRRLLGFGGSAHRYWLTQVPSVG